MIDDVKSGRADFSVILVYDVSRWGRFQDSDESAYYEFICKEAGVAVHYCAEQFENDGSLTATIVKSIKRAMAARYGMSLSVKVFAGQARLAAKGVRFGSAPGYSLRRLLVDEHGTPKMELAAGQRKSLRSDHVILSPGPAEELEVVKSVYDWFIDQKGSLNEIARRLNAKGALNPPACPGAGCLFGSCSQAENTLGTKIHGYQCLQSNVQEIRFELAS